MSAAAAEQLVCAGSAVLDVVYQVAQFPRKAEKYIAEAMALAVGGPAATGAVAAARLGGAPRLVANVGDDVVADMIFAELGAAGIDSAFVQRCAGVGTSCTAVYVDRAGERQLVNYRDRRLLDELPGAADALEPPFAAALAESRWTAAAARLMQAARDAGRPGVLDVEEQAAPELLARASHLAFSAQGLQSATGIAAQDEALRAAAAHSGAFACVTLGAQGVRYVSGGRIRHRPAYQVEAVNTLGAGDVWHAAFALALGRGAEVELAIDYASAAAALKSAAAGGWEALPSHDQVMTLMGQS